MSTTAEDRSQGQVLCTSSGTPHGLTEDGKMSPWSQSVSDVLSWSFAIVASSLAQPSCFSTSV
jgi:hypothetical protein